MLKRFAEILFPSEDAEPDPRERVALATCVVLLEAARADDEFTDAERRHIVEVLQRDFALNEEAAHDLLDEATAARADATDLFRFTRRINDAFTPEEKVRVIEEVWRIFYSDGALDAHEDHLAHKLRNLLNLNHPQMIAAKLKVLDELRGGAR